MVFELVCCGGVAALGILSVFYLFTVYNGLVEIRNNTEKAWHNIDVVLKQRSDLIPNLVDTVKGYMKHERSTLEQITRLRAEIMAYESPAKKAKASEALTEALKSVFAVAENYPRLKASDNFMELQKQLSAMENQIADRREFYNHSVLLLNTRINTFPDMIVAKPLGFREKEYFTASGEEKKAVEVEFG
ncbi:LemA family protein, partial [Candidatus Micrarchaeota archaeon]|nr:LemA family protein [Candidatus Micrarchaeota archaeon]